MEFVKRVSMGAREKSDEMTEKAMEKSEEMEKEFEKAIAALKSSIDIQKLVKIMTDKGEHAAAECLKEVMSLP